MYYLFICSACNEELRCLVGKAGGMRLVATCIRDRTCRQHFPKSPLYSDFTRQKYLRTDLENVCSDALLVSACSLLLVLSRSVRNLRTCIGDEPDLGTLYRDLGTLYILSIEISALSLGISVPLYILSIAISVLSVGTFFTH